MAAGGEIIKKALGDASKSAAKGVAGTAASKAVSPKGDSEAQAPSDRSEPGTPGATPFDHNASPAGPSRPSRAQSGVASTDSEKPTGKEQAKEIALNTTVEAAQGAVQGAMVGGLAGAAAGAAKGAALGLAKDRRIQKLAVGVVALLLILALAIPVGSAVVASTLISTITSGKDENASASAEESGVDSSAILAATAAGEKYQLPWPLVLAATQQKDDVDLRTVSNALNDLDPDHQYRDLTAGSEYQWAERALVISDAADRKAVAEKVEEVTVAALVAAGFSDADAATVFAQALSWALGEEQCRAAGGGGSIGVVDGDSFTFAGATYDAKQVAIMKTVIGVAKTMFPNNAEAAATVGLITTAVESGFKNYANDGEVGPVDGNLSASLRADYERLKFSLTLDHDAVGSDHASVGIVQQQAIFGWGEIPGSTWASDYQGVITRLMTPSFAIARFFERMQGVTGWQSKEPGSVAQTVQVSAFPDAYAERLPLAKAIWAQYADESEAIAIPAGINWSGASEGDTDGSGTVVAACGEGASGFGLASGDMKALAAEILAATDRGEIIWWGDHRETLDQVTRYAKGQPIPEECTLDPRILQTVLIADQLFHKLSVNSLNRRCTGTTPGAGTKSFHWKGRAVDFGFLGGTSTTGGDPNSIRMIKAFAEVAPDGAGVGQLGCDGRGRITQLNEFADGCSHLHLETGPSDTPFKKKGTP